MLFRRGANSSDTGFDRYVLPAPRSILVTATHLCMIATMPPQPMFVRPTDLAEAATAGQIMFDAPTGSGGR